MIMMIALTESSVVLAVRKYVVVAWTQRKAERNVNVTVLSNSKATVTITLFPEEAVMRISITTVIFVRVGLRLHRA